MALQNIRQKSAAAAAVIGFGALLVGCGSRDSGLNAAQLAAGTPVGAPLAVSCEPNQRAVVRQVAVNGALQSQVQCESVYAPAGMNGSYGATAPVGYAPAPTVPAAYGYAPAPMAVPASYGYPPAQAPLENTRIVRTAYPQEVVTRQAPQRVVYQPARERVVTQPKRSVKKSAIIIGSSAGVGAAIGAAAGGKKGAGIGALIGGGGAAVWDQITRRK
jgi:hypothetical protein